MDDSVLDAAESDVEENIEESNKPNINIINTNARSLCPKIDSLIDCFDEMDTTLGIVTETWLADGDSLDRDVRDLAKGAGLEMICLNRPANSRGVAHGGVAVVANQSTCTLKKIDMANPGNFEVLTTLSSVKGHSRNLITVACYLPPNYNMARGREALEHVENVVRDIKRRYKDPFIVVGGDFNQWAVDKALEDFADMKEVQVGPTRKDRCIDRLFTNFGRAISESGTVPPLEPEPGHQGAKSDHRIAFLRANLPRTRPFEWVTYQYRYFNDQAVGEFGQWLAGMDWREVLNAEGSNAKANLYQEEVTRAMEAVFPLITVRKKSTDCPWISNRIRKLIRRRKGIYRR